MSYTSNTVDALQLLPVTLERRRTLCLLQDPQDETGQKVLECNFLIWDLMQAFRQAATAMHVPQSNMSS